MIFEGGYVLIDGKLQNKDVLIKGDIISKIEDRIIDDDEEVFDAHGLWIIPAAVDVHAHFRQPGFENKATILSESRAAAKGGIATALAMPNLKPTPDCAENLKVETDIIARDSLINCYPYGSVTMGENGNEAADYDGLKDKVVAFTDDGRGVNNVRLLREAMLWAKANDALICSHAEMEAYGVSEEAEYLAVMREIELVKSIGCKYHFCHISTRQAFECIKNARKAGVDVTCEVTPHHLTLCKDDICGNTSFKMNPPLRSREDMLATVAGLLDGTATMIATDHAPHSVDEKNVPYELAPNGIIGFETMLPVCYTALVKSGLATHAQFLDWVVYNPARRFNLEVNRVAVGEKATLAVLDICAEHKYLAEEIISKSKNSPYVGLSYYGFNRLTMLNGKVIFKQYNF